MAAKPRRLLEEIKMTDIKELPKHVAIIMDGNGRWAKAKGIPRFMGHDAGMQSMKKIVMETSDIGIKYLTVYAFSTENWKRSAEEVSGIFKLIVKYVKSELQELIENNVKINIFGDYSMLPPSSVKAIDEMLTATAGNNGLIFNIALNYGGRDEIVKAVNEIFSERKSGDTMAICQDELITESDISEHLYTGDRHSEAPDPDLLIRTGGEKRISNFLIWQSAYTEFIFTDTFWPDFTTDEYRTMIEEFTHRDRRYGGRNKEDK